MAPGRGGISVIVMAVMASYLVVYLQNNEDPQLENKDVKYKLFESYN